MLWVTTGAVVTDVVYLIAFRYLSEMKAVDGPVEHLHYRALSPPPLSEVAVRVGLMTNTHLTPVTKFDKPNGTRSTISE